MINMSRFKLGTPVPVLGSSLSTSRFTICMAMISSLFFLWGLSYGLLDSLNKHFQNLFGITKAQSTGLQGAYFGAYFIFSIPASFFIKKFGYKVGIISSLSVFTVGAICFWPCAEAELYGGFLACTFVIGGAIASLEVCSNSYVCVISGQRHAAMYMTAAQGFNGISAFAGPLIASKVFFSGTGLTSFDSVQYVYLAVGLIGIALAIVFAVVNFPEVRQDTSEEEDRIVLEQGYSGLFKRQRLMWGFFAELLYVGAQVSVASLAINYFVETTHVDEAQAANLYAYCQMTFMFGRFASVPFLKFVYPPFMLAIFGIGAMVFAILVSQIPGKGGAFCLFMVFFFESICYPIIFSEATLGLGHYQKYGSAFLAMGVSGGAFYPAAQATLADAKTTQLSYIVVAIGFLTVAGYGIGLCIDSWRRNGFHWRILELTEEEELKKVESVGSRISGGSKSEKGEIDLIESRSREEEKKDLIEEEPQLVR